MDSLLRKLTTDDTLDLPIHCVIERLLYMPKPSDTSRCVVTSKDRKRTVVTIENEEGTLIVTLRVVRRQFEVRQESISELQHPHLNFTKDDVIHFVESVQDTNHIHREFPYVVPGLLVLKHVFRSFRDVTPIQSIEMNFIAPTIVGDAIEIVASHEENNQMFNAYAGTTLLFTISIES